jgi:hypothetical protein
LSPLDRRTFLKSAGAVAAGAALASCDVFSDEPAPFESVFAERFEESGAGWNENWVKVRYEGEWKTANGAGVIPVELAPKRGIEEDARQTEYMGYPVVVPGHSCAETRVTCEVEIDGPVEAGVIARWRHDEAYALLLRDGEALLCRYSVKDRRDFQRKAITGDARVWKLTLTVTDGSITGVVEGESGGEVRLRGHDDEPLPSGAPGVVVNPRSFEKGGRGIFKNFDVSSRDGSAALQPTFIYRFAGGFTPSTEGVDVRMAARAVLPAAVGFQVAENDDFDNPIEVAPAEPQGKWGAVRGVAEQLKQGTRYNWRPFTGDGDERIYGRSASFTTPAPGSAVKFAFGSCTSGRTTDYSSFSTAASFEPDFYLHGGDWGYANLNSLLHSPDHFQARWSRLMRVPEMRPLLDGTPLMFWQDDHDYQADNGWSETIAPYTVWAFDEFHANSDDEYFDVRWGDLHVWCLDCRKFATDPAAPDGPGKSRIGAEQKKWLMDGMTASDAPVRVVAAGMVFRNKVLDDDGWHSTYAYERDELLGFFSELPATTFILSGDSHGHRLIHHFEFGELYEVTASGTDFPPTAYWGQGNNDPEHTLENITDRTGFALVELDPPGENRTVSIKSIASANGDVMFQKFLPVRSA